MRDERKKSCRAKGFDEAVSLRQFLAAAADGCIENYSNSEKKDDDR